MPRKLRDRTCSIEMETRASQITLNLDYGILLDRRSGDRFTSGRQGGEVTEADLLGNQTEALKSLQAALADRGRMQSGLH
ncbi:hypothetical protein H6F67_06640 [Microcoleus sp. FACHB-1515]|uniref:hypothetical protein n=1 Tax=Cyanophyceae TaxID=3028117 RepID=UPI0019B2A392|nr:hypothetical protein [Microcoleus sp. FACHB-1515]MBD2089529.1 hypothetical protein [Microcoleus sp. FACHB-1515]